MAGELALLRLVQLDEEAQAVEEQPAVLQTEDGQGQALLGLDEPAVVVVVWVQLVRMGVAEDIEYVAVEFAEELDVVDVVLAVVATAVAAAAAAAVVVSAIFVAAVVVVSEEALEEHHYSWKGDLVVRIAQPMEPALSAEVDKASPT